MADTKVQLPYEHQEYPKHLYGEGHVPGDPKSQDVVVVNNEEEEEEAVQNGYHPAQKHED